jgi:glutaredoxin 3
MAKVEIYTTGNCIYCVAAKTLLKQKGYAYEEIRVDGDSERLVEMLGRSQRRSVPQVYIDGEYIGGYEELAAAERAGRLAAAGGEVP